MASQVDSMIGDLAGLRARLISTDANATALSALLDDTIEALEGTKADLLAAQEELRRSIENTDANVTALNERLNGIVSEVGQLGDELVRAYAAGNLTAGRLGALFEEVDSLLGDLTDIRKNLSSTDANATVLSARLDSTLSDLEDIKANLTAAMKDLDAVQDKQSSGGLTYLALGGAGIAVGAIAIGLFAWTRKN